MGADDAENVGRDAMAAQDLPAPQGGIEGRPAVAASAAAVVEVAGPVEAEAHREPGRSEEPAPVLVEQGPVRLNSVGDLSPRRSETALDLDDPAEVVQAKDGRLAAVPGEPDDLVGRGGDVLTDIGLKEVIGHPHGSVGARLGAPVEVIAVFAGQIAGGSGRLDEDLEAPRDGAHRFDFSTQPGHPIGAAPFCFSRIIHYNRGGLRPWIKLSVSSKR